MQRPRDRRRGQTTVLDGEKPVIDGFAMAREANIVNARNQSVANTDLPGERATAAQTRTAIRGTLTAEAASQLSHLMNSGLRDNVQDDLHNVAPTEGVERRKIETLPAIISTAIARTDENMIIPQWHQVRNLPGFSASAIRALGRQIFNLFTDVPVEDVQCCTTLSNDENEVKAMMAWIKKNGICNEKMKMDFDQVLPAYAPYVQAWDVEGYSFLLVKDPMGHYVYGWPGGRGVHLEQEAPRPMLR